MDERKRGFERKAASGDLEARAQVLKARERSGEITTKGLEIAAYLGDPASRFALGDDAPKQGVEVISGPGFDHWMEHLEPVGGRESIIRAAAAAAWSALGIYEHYGNEHFSNSDLITAPRKGLELLDKYLLDPTSVEQQQLEDARDLIFSIRRTELQQSEDIHYNDMDDAARLTYYSRRDAESCLMAAFRALQALTYTITPSEQDTEGTWALDFAGEAAKEIYDAIGSKIPEHVSPEFKNGWDTANDRPGGSALLHVMKKEVISWALNENDPVEARVNALEEEK